MPEKWAEAITTLVISSVARVILIARAERDVRGERGAIQFMCGLHHFSEKGSGWLR
ncbi:hypothetical protein [Streptomyces sp. NPDC001292]|uniref:hypothetical protein n=1 Tax=Streptomyces sp. NPDC001292 TaxID=3364558 RepID=UPI003690FC87